MTIPDPWKSDAMERWKREPPYVSGATCAHCGFFNHAESNVRGVDDDQQHCANCGEMFEVNQ